MMNGARIAGLASALGSLEISSEDVEKQTGSPAEFRRERLGINCIRVAAPHETPSELATNAIENLFAKDPSINRNEIDFLIVVTQNPDFRLPTTACLVQKRVGLSRSLLAYDVNQGCSGFIVALAQAKGLVSSGIARRGVVVASEVYNKVIDRGDRNTFGLFGDGAAAVLIEACQPEFGIGSFFFGCDGGESDAIIVRNGGSLHPEKSFTADDYLHMDGKAVFRFVVKTLPSEIRGFLDREKVHLDEIDHWLFHQSNKYMNSELTEKLGIPTEKAHFDIWDIGNTVSATIPILLERMQQKQLISGKRLCLCGFGVGLSWGGCLYHLKDGAL